MALKSIRVAEDLKIADSLEFDAKSGTLSLPEEFYETALEGSGVTLDQLKKVQKRDAELMAATTYAAGERAKTELVANPELTELSLSYNRGLDSTHTYFSREGTTPVRHVVESHGMDGGELKKVHTHVKSLFDDINN